METVKNTVGHLFGGNKENSSEGHSGHHQEHHDQTAASTSPPSDQHHQHSSPADVPSKPASAGNSGNNDQQGQSADGGGDRIQSPTQGPDPALVGDANPTDKLSGTAAPGSHSALFGLTPDGKKNTETSKGSGAPQAAHSDTTAIGGGEPAKEADTSSRAPTGNPEVSEQLNKAEAAPGQKGGQRTDPAPLPAEGGTKPGAGATGLQQGSGNV